MNILYVETSLLKNLQIYFRKQIFRCLICVWQKTTDVSLISWNVSSVALVRSDWNMSLLLINAYYFRQNIIESVSIVLFYICFIVAVYLHDIQLWL